jgi:hypothetical protein
MKLATIEMPKTEARKAFLSYRRAVRERHDSEDEALMRGYRALAAGQQVININEAMKRAGVNSKGLPRIAIARADEKAIVLRWYGTGGVALGPVARFAPWGTDRFPEQKSRSWNFPSLLAQHSDGNRWRSRDHQATVPLIPPDLRPARALKNYHILWEADWQRIPKPRDPALLKHLGGPMYAIVAMWDVTALEAAVIGVTRN